MNWDKDMKNFLKTTVFTAFLCAPVAANAQDTYVEDVDAGASYEENYGNGSLKANLRKIELKYSQNSVSNQKEYHNSPDASLSANEESSIAGALDFALEYQNDAAMWTNGLQLEYGETRIKKYEGGTEKNENADNILLYTDYAYKAWTTDYGFVGPFVWGGYETEFTSNDDAPRKKTLRAKAGMKLFEGEYFKELYAALVEEYDMTYSKHSTKTAAEIGYRFEYPLRDGVKFYSDAYARKYFEYSRYNPTDFEHEVNVNARLDIELIGNLSFAPYVNYKMAKSRAARRYGSNTSIGLSLNYKLEHLIW